MSIDTKDDGLKKQINKAQPNLLPDQLRKIAFGDFLRAMPTHLKKKAGALDSYNLATLHSIGLPEDARAANILRAYARSGTGTLGELAIQSPNTTPAAGQIAVSPNGQIVLLAADAYTSVDVVYVPEKYDVFEVELTGAVASAFDLSTLLPAQVAQGIVMLLEAEATVGSVTGKKIVLAPGAAAPATLQARLNLAKTTVTFNNATDAVTKARLKLALCPTVDADALLEASTNLG